MAQRSIYRIAAADQRVKSLMDRVTRPENPISGRNLAWVKPGGT